jgi:hypothetical protein
MFCFSGPTIKKSLSHDRLRKYDMVHFFKATPSRQKCICNLSFVFQCEIRIYKVLLHSIKTKLPRHMKVRPQYFYITYCFMYMCHVSYFHGKRAVSAVNFVRVDYAPPNPTLLFGSTHSIRTMRAESSRLYRPYVYFYN